MIEDAHWADGATLDLVRFLARRIATLRLLLVVFFRDDELAASHPLSVTLGDLAHYSGVSRIALEALSLPAVSALASGSGVNAERLHHVTGGNPFFVTEVLAAGPDCATRKGCRAASPRRCMAGLGGCRPRREKRCMRLRCAAREPMSPCWRKCALRPGQRCTNAWTPEC